MRGEQAIFNLEIKKKSGLSINPDIHHSKVPSSGKIAVEQKNIQGKYVDRYLNIFFTQFRCRRCI